MKGALESPATRVLVMGIGAFAYSTGRILAEERAEVATYLTRDYGHFPPSLVGATYDRERFPNPCRIFKTFRPDLVVPMSIDWAQAPWAAELRASRVPIFGPIGDGMLIERERDFARRLCQKFGIPFPESHVASNRLEAEEILRRRPMPYVLKNPLCSPTSPLHTILCETVEDTRSLLRHINYAEGVFLQEYLGRAEAGHIAFVSGGEVYPVVTNQEYKRAFAGNLGIVAGAPLGGLVECDPRDKYGLARELLLPLRPWFRKVKYHGPIQVTAVKRDRRWHVIEYNIRIGVTSGAMILRMLKQPLETLLRVARNQSLDLRFRPGLKFGCSVTLAGHGYPYTQLRGPQMPIDLSAPFDPDCDVWWNEVTRREDGQFLTDGHRLADIIGFGPNLAAAAKLAYANIQKIRTLGSYYRVDVGQSLWPPGNI